MKISVLQIKVIHTIIFWVLSGCVLHTLWSGISGTIDAWTWVAVGLLLLECVVLACFRGTCPLTILAERQGAVRGAVTDLFLPRWFADRIFPICGTAYVIGVALILWHLWVAPSNSREVADTGQSFGSLVSVPDSPPEGRAAERRSESPVDREETEMTSPAPDGYLAAPTTRVTHGTVSAVLVLHAWWGLNETTKGLCRRLADAGFLAFAPDLYHGKVADTIEGAEALSQALDAGQARADIAAAMRFLTEQVAANSGSGGTGGTGGPGEIGGTGGSDSPGKLAVIGFSLGAYFALELSNQEPERIGSVVVFYGTGHTDFGRSEAEYLGHFAETDPYESAAAVEELEQLLRQAGRPVTFHQYPGTGHWFFEPDRAAAYNAPAADLAWDRTLAFLRRSAE